MGALFNPFFRNTYCYGHQGEARGIYWLLNGILNLKRHFYTLNTRNKWVTCLTPLLCGTPNIGMVTRMRRRRYYCTTAPKWYLEKLVKLMSCHDGHFVVIGVTEGCGYNRQPAVPPVREKLALRRISVFNAGVLCYRMFPPYWGKQWLSYILLVWMINIFIFVSVFS